MGGGRIYLVYIERHRIAMTFVLFEWNELWLLGFGSVKESMKDGIYEEGEA